MTSEPASTELADALLAELGWVRRLARRLVGEAADDLTQEVAVATLQARPPQAGLRAWLGAVVRKRAARWHRDARRRDLPGLAADPDDVEGDPALVVERLQLQRRLVDAVLALPEPYRSVVVARFFDELSPTEIASRRRVSATVVRQQLARGLSMLRARLVKADGDAWRSRLLVLLPAGGARSILGATLMTKKPLAAGLALCALLGLPFAMLTVDRAPPTSSSAIDPRAASAHDADAAGPVRDDAPPARTPLDSQRRNTPLELRIVQTTGAPLADCLVIVGADDEAWSARSDRDGKASFDGSERAGTVLVLTFDRPPQRFDLDVLQGAHSLTSADGLSVAGRVRVLGDRPPVATLPRLSLSLDPFDTSTLPPALKAQVARDGAFRQLGSAIGADGRFAFTGLPRGWQGTIGIPGSAPFWLHGPGDQRGDDFRSLQLDGPRSDLELVLTPMPVLTGRVVWDDGSPVAQAQVSVRCRFESAVTTPVSVRSTDREGRFVAGLRPSNRALIPAWLDPGAQPKLRDAQISWQHEDALAPQSRTVTASELHDGHDVGRLVLSRAAVVHVVVLDDDGAPIAGALVEGGGTRQTDAAGRVTIHADGHSARTRRIGARGFRVDAYEAEGGDGSDHDPLRFRLQRGNRLTVTVRSKLIPTEHLRLELRSFAPVFTAADPEQFAMPTSYHVAAGGTPAPSGGRERGDPAGATALFPLDHDGLVRLVSLEPGTALRLRVLDRLGQVAGETQVQAPAARADSAAELVVEGPANIVSGVVLLDGAPIAGASVGLVGDGSAPLVQTDAEGRFVTTQLATDRSVQLDVRHPDAVPVRTELRLTAARQDLRFELGRAHAVTLRALDRDGTPIGATL